MNTLSPFPLLRMPGLRDPIVATRSFIAKCIGLARRRADHGAILEYNVVNKLVDREAELRDAGANSAELIAQKIGAVQAFYREAIADGRLTPSEDRKIRAQLDELFAQLITLQQGLAVPATA
jgi:hypothetical protein